MNEILNKLETLYDKFQSENGEATKANALYDKIIENMNTALNNNKTFDFNGDLIVYTLSSVSSFLIDQTKDSELQQITMKKIDYIKSNSSYLQWYFNKKLSNAEYKFKIKVITSTDNTIVNKKIITTLNIILHKLK